MTSSAVTAFSRACLALIAGLAMCGCAGRIESTGSTGQVETLRPCPVSPNCVASDATDGVHQIEPLAITGDTKAGWSALIAYLESNSAFTIKVRSERYLHVEARTRLLGFVDDVEFLLDPAKQAIAVRSASRLGFSDLGANRRRIETIRSALHAGMPQTGSPQD